MNRRDRTSDRQAARALRIERKQPDNIDDSTGSLASTPDYIREARQRLQQVDERMEVAVRLDSELIVNFICVNVCSMWTSASPYLRLIGSQVVATIGSHLPLLRQFLRT